MPIRGMGFRVFPPITLRVISIDCPSALSPSSNDLSGVLAQEEIKKTMKGVTDVISWPLGPEWPR